MNGDACITGWERAAEVRNALAYSTGRVGWFIQERVNALRRARSQLSRAEIEETLAQETASMFGLTRDAALALVEKALP